MYFPTPPHLAHVVCSDSVDDRAGAEEEKRLEERVADQVEHAYADCSRTHNSSGSKAEHHKPKLRDG